MRSGDITGVAGGTGVDLVLHRNIPKLYNGEKLLRTFFIFLIFFLILSEIGIFENSLFVIFLVESWIYMLKNSGEIFDIFPLNFLAFFSLFISLCCYSRSL